MQSRIVRTAFYLVLAFAALGIDSIAHAQTYKYSTLYTFKNNSTAPARIVASLIVDSAGNLYGTSSTGGSNHSFCNLGCGTVFKVTKSGVMSVLHYFQAPPDGVNPQTSLFRDAAGNLYGTTVEGGTFGCGTVFKITPSNVETVLYSFTCGTDGGSPSSVIVDSAHNIYGTAQTNSLAGLVFKIDAKNNFSVLYNFCSLVSCADGELPSGGLTKDAAGNLYGTTSYGGTVNLLGGTVFKVTPSGVETVLHSFGFGGVPGDGADPYYNLIHDLSGNLYGVTIVGGANDFLDEGPGGTLFEVSEADGAEAVLYSFCSPPKCTGGYSPEGPVQMDKAGNLYGVTQGVWEVDTSGEESTVHSFGTTQGSTGLVIDGEGSLYGTTGGANNIESVYKLTLVK
jgi:uncharacterized repeat protein (TIGR03803 family)